MGNLNGANPVIDEDSMELPVPDAEVSPPAAPTEPTATESEAIDRRSRRAGKQGSDTVDLTQSEQFRKYQAEADRKYSELQKQYEAERRKAAEIEQAMFAERTAKHDSDLATLRQRIADADDPDERQQYLDRLIEIGSQKSIVAMQQYNEQVRQWEDYKRTEVEKAGFDPRDPRFQRVYSPGAAGLAEFKADVAEAKAAKYEKELTSAKQAASPETISALVRAELAKALAQRGEDAIDLGGPARAGDDSQDAWQRDTDAFNAGRMSAATYTRKWGTQ